MEIDGDTFFNLTWYELQLRVQRHHRREKIEVQREEMEWARFRIAWADFRNANSSKGSRVRPQDLIKLSIDKEIEESKAVVPDIEAVKKKFGSKVKKKNGK